MQILNKDQSKSKLSRNFSIATLQPKIDRGISQATIETLMTIKENDARGRKAIRKISIMNKLNKDNGPYLKKKVENSANDE